MAIGFPLFGSYNVMNAFVRLGFVIYCRMVRLNSRGFKVTKLEVAFILGIYQR